MYQSFDRRTLNSLGIGATETRNPLPAGQFTIEVYGVDNRAKMAGWLKTNAKNVIILATAAEETGDDDSSNDTYTFITSVPITWDSSVGYPEIMSEVPVTASSPTSSPVPRGTPAPLPTVIPSKAAPAASSPVLTTTRVASSSSAPGAATATMQAASPSSSAPLSTGTVCAIALLVAGGAYLYAKKKGMV